MITGIIFLICALIFWLNDINLFIAILFANAGICFILSELQEKKKNKNNN